MIVYSTIQFLLLSPLSVIATCSQVTNAKQRYEAALINQARKFSELCNSFDKQTNVERQLVVEKQQAECNWRVTEEILEQAKNDYNEMKSAYRLIKQERDEALQEYNKAKEEFDQQQKQKAIEEEIKRQEQNERQKSNSNTVRNWFSRK